MLDHKPTDTNEDSPQPSASPQQSDSQELHRSALFATDPAFQYHKERNAVPETKPHVVQEEVIEQPEIEEVAEIEIPVIQTSKEPVIESEQPVTDAHSYSPFVKWLKDQPKTTIDHFKQPLVPDTEDLLKGKKHSKKMARKKKKKKKKKKKAGAKAFHGMPRSRFSLGEDIFSETLADVLATQGHIMKAIQMYERLSLIYPEKSRLFAAKIEELKKIE